MEQAFLEVLMAEDSPTDLAIAKEAFKTSILFNRLHTVKNGEEVLAFLQRDGAYAAAPAPDLMVLDLNMPRMGGLETLGIIKKHEEWKYIPVVILTASEAETDVVEAYGRHANCYIVKPVDFEQFVNVVHAVENFWSTVVKLPPRKPI